MEGDLCSLNIIFVFILVTLKLADKIQKKIYIK